MYYISDYNSPLGKILLAADEKGLVGLWFERQKYYAYHLPQKNLERKVKPIQEAESWLHIYFSGKEPDFTPPLHYTGTDFQMQVWNLLRTIPYGETRTYGEISKMIAKSMGVDKMSAQAVGGAVSHNPVSIIVPCHRIVGSGGSLAGYAGGIDKKLKLLQYESVDIHAFSVPK